MPVSVRGQFRRSVHLGRDVYGDGAHDGYVVTAKARELAGRVADALGAPVAQRAWSVTGPYGGGKSAFALFLSGLLRGDEAAWTRLRDADAGLADRLEAARGGAFCPVLVVGSREALVPALLRGLAEGLDAFAAHHAQGRPSADAPALRDTLAALARDARQSDATEAAVLDLVTRAARAVHAATGGGLLVVVDEMGKMLEHAALYPDAADLFALQRLAERASRAPEGGEPAPVLLFTILHQAFDRYAGRLGSAQRDEWRKVQGRFEDVAFVAPVEETLLLLAHAVALEPPTTLPPGAADEVMRTLAQTHLGAGADPDAVRQRLADALPLHPAVALLVGPLFRRLAQNERSLFAFLASGEPHGFLDVVGGDVGQAELYRLDHLYDYLVANLGATLFSERMERLWAETEAVLAGLDAAADARLVKHAALLGFAGGLAGLAPTAETLAATAGVPDAEAQAALDRLREARALAFRPFGETYHVWQGSTFDLEAALADARQAVSQRTPLADLLRKTLPARPLVARRHSYRTGATRVFDVVYAGADAARTAAAPRATDGRVVYVLPEADGDAAATVERLRQSIEDPLVFVAVPDGVAALREAVRDLACLDWVRDHAEALRGDAAARREVAEQRAALAAEVERRLAALLATDADGQNPCTWVRAGESFRLGGERALQRALSDACDDVYPLAPEVWNELLNRRKPSASAVRGLKLLLAAMTEAPDRPRLGIEGTPAEYGMYASVLQATGLHRQDADGRWHFGRPDPSARPGCAAVWDAVADALRQSSEPVALAEVYGRLQAPPYGLRPGLVPVFLFAVLASARDEVAVYESGTFVRDLSFETVERLLKSQEKGRDSFALQWVRVDGRRADALAALAPLLGLAQASEPLPVAIRLLGHAHDLPPYVRRTGALSDRAVAVREAMLRATDPTALLFDALPRACGVGSFLGEGTSDAPAYAERLQAALRELGGAYDALLADVEDRIAGALRVRSGTADGRRAELAERAAALMPAATDLRLKAFLVRATDETHDARGWTESLAALVAGRPPAQWTDEDRRRFSIALAETASAFLRLEPLALDVAGDGAADDVRRIRLSVQSPTEPERDGVVRVHPDDDALVDGVRRQLDAALAQAGADPEVQLAALGRVVARLLHERASPSVS